MFRYTDDNEETAYAIESVRVDNETLALRSHRAMLKDLIELGDAPRPYYCGCSHCLNDWDCCGRMVPGHVEIMHVSRRRKVVTLRIEYSRNV